MKEQLEAIRAAAKQALSDCADSKLLETLRVQYLGKKGELTGILKQMGKLSAEERPAMGQLANQVRADIENALAEKQKKLADAMLAHKLESETLDITLPGKKQKVGSMHPLTIVENEIREIFLGMGFSVADGPEVEYDYYNFEALNLPPDHPARDTQDTFYITDNILLRTQTSGVQIRTMKAQQPPIRIIAPGRVYRNDYDQTHTPMFHQMEGLIVDTNISFTNLKGTLHDFLRNFFEEDLQIRFRPSYFPFTEPSAEVDVMGKNGKWLEVLGCGMVHPNVLRNVGIDPEVYSGFAFGMGMERLTMLRYGVTDLRSFFENDLRFLKQFK